MCVHYHAGVVCIDSFNIVVAALVWVDVETALYIGVSKLGLCGHCGVRCVKSALIRGCCRC